MEPEPAATASAIDGSEHSDEYSSIFQKANVGLLLLNREGQVLYANAFCREISGYEPDELRGTGFFELVIPDAGKAQAQREKVLGVFEESVPEFDLTVRRRSGESMDVNIAVTLFDTGADKHALLTIQNITNRKAFERVIESSFDKFIQTTVELDAAFKKIQEQSKALAEYKEKIQGELELAGSVQRSIIPQTFPASELYDIWGISVPSSELGGDYLDVFQLERGRLGILISDVSGHGVHAALITAMAKVYFVSYTRQYNDPAHVLARVNADLEKIFRGTGFYMSAVYSILDLERMSITTATAGHENPLCYNPATKQITRIGNMEGGAIIGSLDPEWVRFESATNQLTEGCLLLYFTDGITEARGPGSEFYGDERLYEYIRRNHYLSAREFTEGLIEATTNFYGGGEANDDRTLVTLQILRAPTPAKGKEEIRDLFTAGQTLLDRSRYREAIEAFQKIVAMDPESFRAHYFLGRARLMLKEFEEAEGHFREVIGLNPDYYQGHYQLGIALFNRGRYREAWNAWKLLKDKAGNYKKVNHYLQVAEARIQS